MDAADARTIQAVLAGDIERYAELVDKYQRAAYALAFSLLGNVEDAKDASQEAFISAYRSLPAFQGRAAFSTWLYRIVVNECQDRLRGRSRQPSVVPLGVPEEQASRNGFCLFVDVDDPAAGPTEQAAQRELAHELTAAIARLPLQQRTAFVLHHVQGLPLEDTAAVMRCRVGTVKSHVFRAVTALRTALAPWVKEVA